MNTLPYMDKSVNLSPHVVILGTGASKASYLHSGCIGNPIPLMKDIVDMLDLRSPIIEAGLDAEGIDFEAFYDDLATSAQNSTLQRLIEDRVYSYFSQLHLPDRPTIYDYLLVSLRDKDLIATFNWDPFLLQAYRRNIVLKRLPRIAFLHGNVSVGICYDDKISGSIEQVCSKCGKKLIPSRLLYPVKHKDYISDPFIKSEWNDLSLYLEQAYFLTIFGYSAPKTDVEASNMMLEVWTRNPTPNLAQVNIIDTSPKSQLEDAWSEFFVRQHYGISENIFDNYLMIHPRRSCEALAAATLMLKPWRDNPMPQFETIKKLHEWISPLVEEEDLYDSDGKSFSGMPLSS